MLCYVKSPSLSLLACKIGLWGHCDASTAKDNEAKSFFLHRNKILLVKHKNRVFNCTAFASSSFLCMFVFCVCCVCKGQKRAFGILLYLLRQNLSRRPWLFSARLAARKPQPFSFPNLSSPGVTDTGSTSLSLLRRYRCGHQPSQSHQEEELLAYEHPAAHLLALMRLGWFPVWLAEQWPSDQIKTGKASTSGSLCWTKTSFEFQGNMMSLHTLSFHYIVFPITSWDSDQEVFFFFLWQL